MDPGLTMYRPGPRRQRGVGHPARWCWCPGPTREGPGCASALARPPRARPAQWALHRTRRSSAARVGVSGPAQH
eukprot:11216759-Lingulodinium_polyedra.AAC.1